MFAAVIFSAGSSVLTLVIREKAKPGSAVYTDSLSGCDVPDVPGFRYFRINHSGLFADSRNHINGIKNFWSQAIKTSGEVEWNTQGTFLPAPEGV
jgi:transposase